jgi:TPR repeat protein
LNAEIVETGGCPEMSETRLKHALKLKGDGKFAEAIELFLTASNEQNYLSQWHLAECYEKGPVNVRNLKVAQNWYEKAALSENLWFAHSLARFFERTGQPNKAFELVSQLAAKGYQPSIFRLGRYYEVGHGTPIDHKEALRLIEVAASMGHVFAQRAIAMKMMRGEYGVLQIPLGALKFLDVLLKIIAIGAKDPWDPKMVN